MTGEGAGWVGVAFFRPEGAAIYQPRASPWVDVPQSLYAEGVRQVNRRDACHWVSHLGDAGELRGLGGTFRAEGDGESVRSLFVVGAEGLAGEWKAAEWRVGGRSFDPKGQCRRHV
jgi:hypothetical protein